VNLVSAIESYTWARI